MLAAMIRAAEPGRAAGQWVWASPGIAGIGHRENGT